MSDAMERMTGWRPQDVVGQPLHRGRRPGGASPTPALGGRSARGPDVEQIVKLTLRGPDGRLVPAEVSSIGMVDADGNFAGIHGSTRDISERARLEQELRESEERYRYLVASSPDLVWVTDEHGVFTFISDASRTMVGREPAELMGQPFQSVFAPDAVRDATIRFRWVVAPSERGPSDAPAVPSRRRPRRTGRDQRHGHDR